MRKLQEAEANNMGPCDWSTMTFFDYIKLPKEQLKQMEEDAKKLSPAEHAARLKQWLLEGGEVKYQIACNPSLGHCPDICWDI